VPAITKLTIIADQLWAAGGEDENTGTDDRADAEKRRMKGAKRPMQALLLGVARLHPATLPPVKAPRAPLHCHHSPL
jgi:hypothetical protein